MTALLLFIADVLNFFLPDSLARWIARKWAVDHSAQLAMEEDIDVIVPVAHGAVVTTTFDARLTRGVEAVTRLTVAIRKGWPEAKIFFGAYSECKYPEMERKLKQLRLLGATFTENVKTTILECLAVKKMLTFTPKKMIIVTDQAHSIRCWIVWKTFFPQTKIFILPVPVADAVDPKSPMATYHNIWRILVLQMVPIPVYRRWARKGPEFLATKAHYGQPSIQQPAL